MNAGFRSALQVFRFGVSAVGALLVDKAVFAGVLAAASDDLSRAAAIALAQTLARIASGHCNYFCNRFWVFRAPGGAASYLGYWTLVFVKGVVLVAGTTAVAAALDLRGQRITLANVALEVVLFALSFAVQKAVIFKPSAHRP